MEYIHFCKNHHFQKETGFVSPIPEEFGETKIVTPATCSEISLVGSAEPVRYAAIRCDTLDTIRYEAPRSAAALVTLGEARRRAAEGRASSSAA